MTELELAKGFPRRCLKNGDFPRKQNQRRVKGACEIGTRWTIWEEAGWPFRRSVKWNAVPGSMLSLRIS